MKICIGIPSPASVHPEFAFNNLPSIISYSREHIKDLELYVLYKQGVMTSSNRNYILKMCLESGIDGILWLDTDMLFPPQILKMMVDADVDVIGSIYCKRSAPYDPCVYYKGGRKETPYKVIDVTKLTGKDPVEVDGLGFGGMYVKTQVYKDMGDEKWMRYGRNFGIPYEMEDQESHDLIFCKTAQKYGKKIYVHPQIKAIHIGEKLVEVKDWERTASVDPTGKTIAVLLPSINHEKAEKAVKLMQLRAGKQADYYIIDDVDRSGFMSVINDAVKRLDYDYYIYTAEDAYAGWRWLKIAFDHITDKGAGLLGFNDGKNMRFNDRLATFGMVEKNWMKQNYGGDLFFSGYHSHYADVELSLMAIRDGRFAYTPTSVLCEVDYDKHSVNEKDKDLFNKRKKLFFNTELQNLFE